MVIGELTREADVVVIGAGPGGYAAAFHAADLGLETVLVDSRKTPGGVCLHVGCIPSKALLHAAALLGLPRHAAPLGIEFKDPQVDLDKLRSWKEGVVNRLTSGLGRMTRSRGVDYLQGRAVFESSSSIRIQNGEASRIHFRHAILATGSRPLPVPGIQIDSPRVIDSTGALGLERVPETLLVVGGGYIGLELGTVYAALGSRVSVVELTDGLLPGVDRDLVRPLEKRVRASFEGVHLNSSVTGMEETEKGVEVEFEGEIERKKQVFECVLVSVGRRPNSENLGLEKTGLEVSEDGFVLTDEQCRTRDPRIFAVGDVAGQPLLAHKASREGKVAAEVIAGRAAAFDNLAIPAVVFTDPEIAWCGWTETEAKSQKKEVRVSRFPWAASGRALTLDRSDGLTKILFDPETERVMGVGIVGPGAGELIAEGVLAVEMAAVAEDLAATIHPHPTLSETLMESAEGFFGQSTHIYRKRKG
ncbi:MAG: dihydrolipoyl dehydrogenase [Acidobacteriota bacterium]